MEEREPDQRASAKRGEPSREEEREGKRARSGLLLGRRIVTGVFWVLTLYMAAVGFYSIVPQVFAPEAAGWAKKAVPERCEPGIRDLKSELLAEASARIAAGGHAEGETSLQRWLRSWDERYLALHNRCRGETADTYEQLGRLRDRTEATLERFERDHAPVARRIDSALAPSDDSKDPDESSR